MPLRSLLQSPTIADMAAVIIQGQAEKLDHGDLDLILAELADLSDEVVR